MKYKLKHWWWRFILPPDYLIDETILKLSRANSANERVSEKLTREFLEKYYVVVNLKEK